VAARTLPAIGPRQELPVVLVLVTVLAHLVRHRHLEVGAVMALLARDYGVLPDQWVLRLRMVESLLDVVDGFPGVIVVARRAQRGQRSFVRVFVAVLALAEREAGVVHSRLRPIFGWLQLVALFALRLEVRAG
jgi:hypothetical protein